MADGRRNVGSGRGTAFCSASSLRWRGVIKSAVRNYELGLRAHRSQHLEAIVMTLGVDPAVPCGQELDTAVRAWAAMRTRRDSGEISEEEYLDWKREETHC